MTPIVRFLSKVEVLPNGCHRWLGAHDKYGYARFWFEGRTWRAHRWIHEAVHEPLLDVLACHSCDTPGCVNVDHVFPGTNQENVDDAVRKGRFGHLARVRIEPTGEENGNHKLTTAEVIEIRTTYKPGRAPHASPTSLRALAAKYGVSKFAIQYVLKGGWAHLTSSIL